MDRPTQVSRRTALGLLGSAAAGAALIRPGAATAAPDPAGSADAATDTGVQLVDNGATVTLSNSKISVVVNKATAQIPSLQLVGSKLGNEAFNLVSGTN